MASHDVEAKTVVDAKKETKDGEAAAALLDEVSKVVAMKGKKVRTFDLKKKDTETEEVLAAIVGPTGNLRAPTLRRGKTLLVGFNEDAYSEAL